MRDDPVPGLGLAFCGSGESGLHKSLVGCCESAVANVRAIDECMETFVGNREIAGAVTLVADAERILHLGAVGDAKRQDTSSGAGSRCASTRSSGSLRCPNP